MPKDTKSKKNGSARKPVTIKDDMVLAADVEGTVYGQTTRILGDCNFMVLCFFDGVERLCHLRKSAKKGEKVAVESVVLLGLRDYQDSKGDIVYVYRKEQAALLRQKREIPSKVIIQQEFEEEEQNDDTGFDFETI
jgi:initiation factor 1A